MFPFWEIRSRNSVDMVYKDVVHKRAQHNSVEYLSYILNHRKKSIKLFQQIVLRKYSNKLKF